MIRFRGIYPVYDDSAFLTACVYQAAPQIQIETVKIPQRPGVLMASKDHGARYIRATFELLGHSAQRNADIAWRIVRWATSAGDERLILDEYPDRYFLAQLSEVGETDFAQTHPELQLTFHCANPYGFSINERTSYVGGAILYDGDVEVWPRIVYKPSAAITSPSWSDGKHTITLEGYTVQAGHEIVIDNANRNITDNGVSVMEYLPLSCDWIHLARGENAINGAGGSVVWRDIFL